MSHSCYNFFFSGTFCTSRKFRSASINATAPTGQSRCANTGPVEANASERLGLRMQHERIAPALTQAPESDPLRVKDIATALRVDSTTVYREITAGRLESYRIGTGRGTIRVSRAAFLQYLAERGIPTSELAVAL